MFIVSEQNYLFHLFECYTREANMITLATNSYVNCCQISWLILDSSVTRFIKYANKR